MSGLSAEETADLVGPLLWSADRVGEAVGEWCGAEGVPDALRVWASTAAARLAEHGEIWRRQLPESVLLDPDSRVRPRPSVADPLRATAPVAPDRDGLELVVAQLDADAAALAAGLAVAGPVSDGALLRTGSLVESDLRELIAAAPAP